MILLPDKTEIYHTAITTFVHILLNTKMLLRLKLMFVYCHINLDFDKKKKPQHYYSFFLPEVAPYPRGGGTRQQVVLEGNRLVLSCLVGGSWPLQYRWTLNNSNVTDWTPQHRSGLAHSSPVWHRHPGDIPAQVFSLRFARSWSWSRGLLTSLPWCQSSGALEPKQGRFGSPFFPTTIILGRQGQVDGGVKRVKLPDNWSRTVASWHLLILIPTWRRWISTGGCRAASSPDKLPPLCRGTHTWSACSRSPLFTAGQSSPHCREYMHSIVWLLFGGFLPSGTTSSDTGNLVPHLFCLYLGQCFGGIPMSWSSNGKIVPTVFRRF